MYNQAGLEDIFAGWVASYFYTLYLRALSPHPHVPCHSHLIARTLLPKLPLASTYATATPLLCNRRHHPHGPILRPLIVVSFAVTARATD